MRYTAHRPSRDHAWLITASDGTDVIAIPSVIPPLVAHAIAAAFTAEAARLAREALALNSVAEVAADQAAADEQWNEYAGETIMGGDGP